MVRLEVEGLSFSYRDRPVLEGVGFAAESPGVVGLVGPNGSGKTTLIKCIDGILRPEGTALLDGATVASLPRPEVARRVAYVPQGITNHSHATVYETVLMGRRPHLSWRVSEEDEEAVVRAMEALKVEAFAFRRLRDLSGGERQRVMVARALAQGSPLMLLDEPTSALDLRNGMEVMETVGRLAHEGDGRLVVMAIHDLTLAARSCTMLVVLKHGRVHASGPPAEVLTPDLIAEVYGVEAAVEERDGVPYIFPLRPRPDL
ncbi:ABC transporter ATP-binding protein [Methanofollis formosanus]|uniref:Cobalamin import ATP-binding protein BtuD n=1 Tax=Methanofollis formosanus TaxID=299308 RepID=A0A8G1A359_9EURY|nr:ABC transporter ATP-binding protein [Methanofollis formosanus]QYZ80317.1 ABC transporter ATP-binding protein [Methanofollis formosanus]